MSVLDTFPISLSLRETEPAPFAGNSGQTSTDRTFFLRKARTSVPLAIPISAGAVVDHSTTAESPGGEICDSSRVSARVVPLRELSKWKPRVVGGLSTAVRICLRYQGTGLINDPLTSVFLAADILVNILGHPLAGPASRAKSTTHAGICEPRGRVVDAPGSAFIPIPAQGRGSLVAHGSERPVRTPSPRFRRRPCRVL